MDSWLNVTRRPCLPGLWKARLFCISKKGVQRPSSPCICRLRPSCSRNRLRIFNLNEKQTLLIRIRIEWDRTRPPLTRRGSAWKTSMILLWPLDWHWQLTKWPGFPHLLSSHTVSRPTDISTSRLKQSRGKCCQHRLKSQTSAFGLLGTFQVIKENILGWKGVCTIHFCLFECCDYTRKRLRCYLNETSWSFS